MSSLLSSLRVTFLTLLVCGAGYTAVVLGIARVFAHDTAEGSLLECDGRTIGSRRVAQKFTKPRYFWPRPSAVDYDAAGAGGSNKSPASPDLRGRARELIERYGADANRPLPAELAAASGSGLDPHLTVGAARYQAGRIAAARGLTTARVEALVGQHAFSLPGAFGEECLVNVLELNLALDALEGGPRQAEASAP